MKEEIKQAKGFIIISLRVSTDTSIIDSASIIKSILFSEFRVFLSAH